MLSLAGIHKRLGARPVLQGLDLEVRAGETVAILGPNGSGKSTLLRVAAATSRVDQGSVVLAGIDARKDPDGARRHVSLLLQHAPVYGDLTPHDHLRWWAKLWGPATGAVASATAIEDATRECGLAHQAHRPAATLSRGQQQRLALAMALLPEAPLLVLDEPYTALDAEGQAWLDDRLAARADAHGRSTLLALHDAAHAAKLADRVLHLAGGRLA